MRLRWKLLILLLLVSLVPVGIMAWTSLRSMETLGEDLAVEMRSRLASEAQIELSDAVAGLGHIMRLRRFRVEELLRSLAAGVESQFECSDAEPMTEPIWSEAFDQREVPGLVSPITGQPWRDDASLDVGSPVTYALPSFFLAADQSRQDPGVRADLAHLLPVFDALAEDHGGEPSPGIQTWFVGTATGLLASWPGHGETPAAYDPRKRPWYKLAVEAGDLVVTPPYIAIAQLEPVLSMVMPLTMPDGSTMGVAGIDLSMSSITQGLHLPTAWGGSAAVQIVRLGAGGETLEVIASESYEGGELALESWDVERTILTQKEVPHLDLLIAEMSQQASGVVPLEAGGELDLWAFADAGVESTWLLVRVPDSAIFDSARAVAAQVTSTTAAQVLLAGGVAIVIALLLVIVAASASRSITRPVRSLVASAEAVAAGDLETRASVMSRDEIGDLAASFNEMIPRLQRELVLQGSLNLAAQVQQQLLPEAVPEISGWEIAARCIYCDETGGDYYDFLLPAGTATHWCTVIGDVTGHGISAALTMATARASLHAMIESTSSLDDVATAVNRQLFNGALPGRFMTMLALDIEIGTGAVTWLSAGHDPAVIWTPSTRTHRTLSGVDPPLAVLDDHEFTMASGETIAPGEVVAIMTDGLFECRNAKGEMCGKDRLNEAMSAPGASADEVADALIGVVDHFRGDVDHHDDVTLVVIRRCP